MRKHALPQKFGIALYSFLIDEVFLLRCGFLLIRQFLIKIRSMFPHGRTDSAILGDILIIQF